MSTNNTLHHERAEQAIQDCVQRAGEEFAEYVLDEADHSVVDTECTVETIGACLRKIEASGYRVPYSNDLNNERVYTLLTPQLYWELRDTTHRLPYTELDTRDIDTMRIYGTSVVLNRLLPDSTGVVLHVDAIVPNIPLGAYSGAAPPFEGVQVQYPWLVRDPTGVVCVELTDDVSEKTV